jgi:hypothetical protein
VHPWFAQTVAGDPRLRCRGYRSAARLVAISYGEASRQEVTLFAYRPAWRGCHSSALFANCTPPYALVVAGPQSTGFHFI